MLTKLNNQKELKMPYKKSYSKTAIGINAQQVWTIWSDIDKRHTWDSDTEWAKIEGEFKAGNTFLFKPKGGPKLKMTITEATPNKSFTDCFKLPLARLYGVHEIEEIREGVRLTTTMIVKGPLYWLWQKLLAEKIVATLPNQTDLLIEAAKKVKV
jgi:hypothetical protein